MVSLFKTTRTSGFGARRGRLVAAAATILLSSTADGYVVPSSKHKQQPQFAAATNSILSIVDEDVTTDSTAAAWTTNQHKAPFVVTRIPEARTAPPLTNGVKQPANGVKEPAIRTTAAVKDPAADAAKAKDPVRFATLDPWRQYDELRGELDFDHLYEFYGKRPGLVAGRLWHVAQTLLQAKREWDATPSDFDASTGGPMTDKASSRGKVLCERLASLGPVSVKICQTLSQRHDLVGKEVASSLKRLQTQNLPFSNHIAMDILRESFSWDGPTTGVDGLFQWMSPEPVAVASLGQVYKAQLHDGRYVAVKIQRPDGTALLTTDALCFRLVWGVIDKVKQMQKDPFASGLIAMIVERVASDMAMELDYIQEAQNGKRFEASLDFLGFVKTPILVPEYCTDRVLTTEWVTGGHLTQLPTQEQQLAMTRMAVQACTASLVLTGYVHADPHEGNIMLDTNDGKLVFMDFGLMSEVSTDVMEAFARGIQGCLNQDWIAVTHAFQDAGFINNPVEWKLSVVDKTRDPEDHTFGPVGTDPETGEDLGVSIMAQDLGREMCEVEGGLTKFGALATVLNTKLSYKWKMETPPYVILLIRTFLTLEGIASRADPNLNIYQVAMPWAVRRALTPSTAAGIETLRSTILKKDNRVQWEKILEMLEAMQQQQQPEAPPVETQANAEDVSAVEDGSPILASKDVSEEVVVAATTEYPTKEQISTVKSHEQEQRQALQEAVGNVLGSPEGKPLRHVLRDLDSTDLVQRLLSKDAKPLRHKASVTMAAAMLTSSRQTGPVTFLRNRLFGKRRAAAATLLETTQQQEQTVRPEDAAKLLSSDKSRKLQEKRSKWQRKVVYLLAIGHVRKQWKNGILAWMKFMYLCTRIALGAFWQRILTAVRPASKDGNLQTAPR